MRVKYFITILFIFMFSIQGYSQYSETIRSGRPGQAIYPFSVGKNIFQIQTGYEFNGYRDKDKNEKGYTNLNNTVMRIGLSRNFEVNTTLQFQHDKTELPDSSFSKSGLSIFDVGFHYSIHEGEGIIPTIGLQSIVSLKLLSREYEPDYISPKFIFATQNSFPLNLSLITNWGIDWNGNNAVPKGFYVINISGSVTEYLSWFIENYGSLEKKNYETRFDLGFGYLLLRDLQLDIFAGIGSNKNVTDSFISTGISWRYKAN